MPHIDIRGSRGSTMGVGVAVFARRTCDVDSREASFVCGYVIGAILALSLIDNVADSGVLWLYG